MMIQQNVLRFRAPMVGRLLSLFLGLSLTACGEDAPPHEHEDEHEESCEDVVCGEHASCDPQIFVCTCDESAVEQADGSCAIEPPTPTCDDLICEANSVCDPTTVECVCLDGFIEENGDCIALACTEDADCDDGLACNGVETCDTTTNTCVAGTPLTCDGFNELCLEDSGECGCPENYRLIDGVCTFARCQDDADCDDGLACNGVEICDLELNLCKRDHESLPSCNANFLCDEADGTCSSCRPGFALNANNACVASAATCEVDADCDDGNACNGLERCVNNLCANASPAHIPEGNIGTAYCEPTDRANGYRFHCNPGHRMVDGVCTMITDCETDADCDDGVFCNGVETCQANGRCLVGGASYVGAHFCLEDHEICHEELQACDCRPGFIRENGTCVRDWCAGLTAAECDAQNSACPVPQAPAMNLIRNDVILEFQVPEGYAIEIAELHPNQRLEDAVWSSSTAIDLSTASHNPLRVIARSTGQDCQLLNEFDWTYTLVDEYPNTPSNASGLLPDSNAVPAYIPAANGTVSNTRPPNPNILGWATGWSEVIYGGSVDSGWRKPYNAVGPALGTMGIVVLGNHGEITLTFDPPIADGEGPDFAVYENGFLVNGTVSMVFAEVGFVEVSSDGIHFLRFDTHALQPQNPGAYGNMPPKMFNNIAGTQPAFWGVPFDLRELINREEVIRGLVDLHAITHVRVIDIVGDETAVDSFGNYVYDATPTWGSGGFDLDAIGVLNQAAP